MNAHIESAQRAYRRALAMRDRAIEQAIAARIRGDQAAYDLATAARDRWIDRVATSLQEISEEGD